VLDIRGGHKVLSLNLARDPTPILQCSPLVAKGGYRYGLLSEGRSRRRLLLPTAEDCGAQCSLEGVRAPPGAMTSVDNRD
jgi:hypothetical protein